MNGLVTPQGHGLLIGAIPGAGGPSGRTCISKMTCGMASAAHGPIGT